MSKLQNIVLLCIFVSILNSNDVQSAPIIIDNEDPEISRSSGWSFATAAQDHFGANSRFASVGGDINTYRFTPDIPVSGEFDVFAWNSCFNPRATNVPHRIVHDLGETIVSVDQDCITGSSNEWFAIGTYFFDADSSGYVEISDTGLSSGSYIGADAIMFSPVGEIIPPDPDITPPAAPENVVANPIAATLIALSWDTAFDDVAVTRYEIYRDNILITDVTATSYTDSGLSANTLYEYYIIAFDAAGNQSGSSITASTTTLISGGTSIITDLFETASLDAKWNLFGAEHLALTNPITLENGQLKLRNTSSIPWFHSERSFLMYVNYIGEFDIRTTVRVRQYTDQTLETTNGFRFGGIMVRNPGFGYKFLVVGRRGGSGNQVETKNTTFPGGGETGISSPRGFNTPDGTQSSELRLVRDSTGTITAFSRAIGASTWTPRSFPSTNEPVLGGVTTDSVQIGLIVYADAGNPDFVGIFDEIINTVVGTTELIFDDSFE